MTTKRPPKKSATKVLILEDDHFVLSMWRNKLPRLGCEGTFCESPLQAKPLIDRGYRPDIIISDSEMPGMSGSEFCAFIKTACPGTPFVLISGNTNVFELGAACGADEMFLKPLSNPDILALLERHVPPV
jgi:two-component system response regulator